MPTKRAPDAGDSAQISSSFTRLSIFLAGRLRRPRPSAGNAYRWAFPSKRNMKTQLSLAIILISVLVSCSSASNTISPTQIPTETAVSTIAPVPYTPEPSITVTPLVVEQSYSSEIYPASLFTKKLSEIVVSPDEIPALDPNYPYLIQPQAQDLTNGISNCNNDCQSIVWVSQKAEGFGDRQVSIILIRMDTDSQAAESVVNSWNNFSQVESGTGFVEGTLIQSDLLPNNSKVGIKYKEPDVEVMFTASRGPIYMMFVYSFKASGDLALDFGSIQHLAILQIKKLEAAGYPK